MLFSTNAFSQRNCYKLDSLAILKNENLDLFLKRLESENFTICTSKSEIPKHVIRELKCINKEFSISELNGEFQDSDVMTNKLPKRGLKFLAKNNNTLLLSYAIARGPGMTGKFLFIDYDDRKINNIWIGSSLGIPKYDSLENLKSNIEWLKNGGYGFQSNSIFF